jgi:hypothetical protein
MNPLLSMAETIPKDAVKDLVRLKDEFDGIVESLELMADKEFMTSYRKARQQVRDRDLDDWDTL